MIDVFVQTASVFQRPHELAALLEHHRQNWTLHALFNNPKLKPFKEAWQAAVFGLGYEELTGRARTKLQSSNATPRNDPILLFELGDPPLHGQAKPAIAGGEPFRWARATDVLISDSPHGLELVAS